MHGLRMGMSSTFFRPLLEGDAVGSHHPALHTLKRDLTKRGSCATIYSRGV